MQGISDRHCKDFQQIKEQNNVFTNKFRMEEKVKKLIIESLNRRLEGWGEIDNLYPNEELVKRWITVILVLGRNKQDISKTAWELYKTEPQPYINYNSIEEIRALVRLVEERLLEEIWSYSIFLNDCDGLSEKEIMEKIEEPLSYISSGDLNL